MVHVWWLPVQEKDLLWTNFFFYQGSSFFEFFLLLSPRRLIKAKESVQRNEYHSASPLPVLFWFGLVFVFTLSGECRLKTFFDKNVGRKQLHCLNICGRKQFYQEQITLKQIRLPLCFTKKKLMQQMFFLLKSQYDLGNKHGRETWVR